MVKRGRKGGEMGEKSDLLPSECIVRVDLLIHHHPCLALETPVNKDQGEVRL